MIEQKICQGRDMSLPSTMTTEYESPVSHAINAYFSSRSLCSGSMICDLISHITGSVVGMNGVSGPFSPDNIVYCKSKYLFIKRHMDPGKVKGMIEEFEAEHGYFPRVILEEGGGLTVVDENEKLVKIVRDVYLDMMKISYLSRQFGGPHLMTPDQVNYIKDWEVERYRRKVAKGGQ